MDNVTDIIIDREKGMTSLETTADNINNEIDKNYHRILRCDTHEKLKTFCWICLGYQGKGK